MPLLLLFIVVPLIEIALFIQVGSLIGLGWTLLIVVVTAVIGTSLVKRQGRDVLRRVQGSLDTLTDPTEPLAHGAMILFAGALLLTPGFFTDAMGFALLVPRLREAAFRWIRARVVVSSITMGQGAKRRRGPEQPGDVIDGDYSEIRSEPRRHQGPSGWTRD